MLVVVAILVSVLSSDASPTNFQNAPPDPILGTRNPTTPSGANTPAPQLRSTWEIVWSCLVTIFACTWVSVHPNSPGVEPGKRTATLRKVELMIWGLLAPEMILLWALRQWVGARKLTELYKDFDGWTITHAHFLQMGGFVLSSGQKDIEALSPEQFHKMVSKSKIRFPTISQDEIRALGKGDGLSKAIVLCQTLWFVAQCISRAAEGLVITEIELVTCAFCFLNGFMYFLWWDKPLDATFVVRLPMVDRDNDDSDDESILPLWPFDERLVEITTSLYLAQDNNLTPEVEPISVDDIVYTNDLGHIDDLPPAYMPPDSAVYVSPASLGTMIATVPASSLPQPGQIIVIPRSFSSRIYHTLAVIWRRLDEMQTSQCDGKIRGRPSLPMFGALIGMSDRTSNEFYLHHPLAISVVAMIFGGIHCAAWRFPFASSAERMIWRVASLIIVLTPSLFLALTLPLWSCFAQFFRPSGPQDYPSANLLQWWILNNRRPTIIIVVPIYLFARVILLVEGADTAVSVHK